MRDTNRRWRRLLPTITLAFVLGGCLAEVERGRDVASGRGVDGEWPTYGNDPGGTRYSPLGQIDRGNVHQLRVAWTYRTGENAGTGFASGRVAVEATPIVVDGTLYFSTPFGRVIALDPETGAERWTHDPNVDRARYFSSVTSRGVSTWLDAAADAGRACRRRIYVGTIDARLIALDAATGAPCRDFGRDGTVDLTDGIDTGVDCACYQVTSPPAILNGLEIPIQPVATGTRLVHEHQLRALRLQLADQLVDVALPRADRPQRHHLGLPLLRGVGDRDGLLVHIEPHIDRGLARLSHG